MTSRSFVLPGEQPPAKPPCVPGKPPAGRRSRRELSKSAAQANVVPMPRRLRPIEGITATASASLPTVPVLPASAAIGIPELVQRNSNPLGLAPRVFRMSGPLMEPTLRHGDLLIAVPVSAYHCEGLYLLSFGPQHMAVWRCEGRQGAVHAWKDGDPKSNRLELSRAEFEDAVLAQVAITGRLVAGGLLPEVRGTVG